MVAHPAMSFIEAACTPVVFEDLKLALVHTGTTRDGNGSGKQGVRHTSPPTHRHDEQMRDGPRLGDDRSNHCPIDVRNEELVPAFVIGDKGTPGLAHALVGKRVAVWREDVLVGDEHALAVPPLKFFGLVWIRHTHGDLAWSHVHDFPNARPSAPGTSSIASCFT